MEYSPLCEVVECLSAVKQIVLLVLDDWQLILERVQYKMPPGTLFDSIWEIKRSAD